MSLITTISEFKKYIAIDANTSISSLQPYIDTAEQDFIVPLLGQAFYDYYKPLYEDSVKASNPVALSDDDAKLLPYIQRPLCYYAQLLAIPHLAATFGDMGVRQHRADESDPAPRWLIEKLQFNALTSGDTHADKLLEFLEKYADADTYSQWFGDADANPAMSGYIVHSTAVASKHIAINNSRRVYLQLRDKIREIETRIIPKLIGKDQYNDLVADIKAGTISAEYRALLDKLEPVIAKRALFMQLPFMRVQITNRGIFTYSGTDSLFLIDQLATDADIKILRSQLLDEKELGYLADEHELRQFILDNIDDYPLIKASAVYTTEDVKNTSPMWDSKNSSDNKFFAV